MKKYLLSLMIILIAILLISCQKDIDNDEEKNNDIPDINDDSDPKENEKCFVSFYVNDELYDKKEVDKNSKVKSKSVSVDSGYYFYGWFTIDNVKWDFGNLVTEDLDLYAHIGTLKKGNISIRGNRKACEEKPEKYIAEDINGDSVENVVWKVKALDNEDASNIATISEDGILTVVGSGMIQVVGMLRDSNDIYGALDVRCYDKNEINPLIEITSRVDELYVLLSDKHGLPISLEFENETSDELYYNKTVYYSSSDESIATVDERGNVFGVKEGECTITVTSDYKDASGNSITKEIKVTIYTPKAPTVWELPESKEVNIGTIFNLDVQVGSPVENSDAIFTSSNPDIITVYNKALIANKEGTVTITATSVADPTKVATTEVNVVFYYWHNSYSDPIFNVGLGGYGKMYVGYSQQLYLNVPTYCKRLTFTYTSSDESVCIVDERGFVTAVGPGKARITVISNEFDIARDSILITCETEPQDELIPNLAGMEINIMSYGGLLSEVDPFLDDYCNIDKAYKQRAWREVEEEYNCQIKAFECPIEEVEASSSLFEWHRNKQRNAESPCDILYCATSQKGFLFPTLNISEYYYKYGKGQMDSVVRDAIGVGIMSFASTGLNTTESYVDLGLYYNYGLLKRLGLEDPATLFNEGKWNYTGFINWVHSAQEKMGDGKYVLGGHPCAYYAGLTNAAGVITSSSQGLGIMIDTIHSKNAMTMMRKLVTDGCVSTDVTWSNEKTEAGNDFFDEGVLMTTGNLRLINSSNGWSKENGLNWEGEIEFGYVPFPYPDELCKENSRIGVPEVNLYYYVKWNNRDFNLYYYKKNTEDIYRVINDMFLRTRKYQEEDENFNAKESLRDNLRNYISNEESITAMLYYDSSRAFFDPHFETNYYTSSPVVQASVDVMYGGEEFYSVFKKIIAEYDQLCDYRNIS